MASRSSLAAVLGQVLELQGEALFDKIAELEPTAERKAQLRWALPGIAQGVMALLIEVDEERAAADRTQKAKFVSELAVKIFAGPHGTADAREAVHLAKLIVDESELVVLADEEATSVMERTPPLRACDGCGFPEGACICAEHANGGPPS